MWYIGRRKSSDRGNAVASKHDLPSGWVRDRLRRRPRRRAGDTNAGRAGDIKATRICASARRRAAAMQAAALSPHAVSECTPKRYDVGFGAKTRALSGFGENRIPPLLMLKPNKRTASRIGT